METQKLLDYKSAVKLFRKLLSKEEIIGLYNNGKTKREICAKTKHYFFQSDGSVYFAQNFNAGTPMHLVYDNRDYIETLYNEL
jgi:hypothetical protein